MEFLVMFRKFLLKKLDRKKSIREKLSEIDLEMYRLALRLDRERLKRAHKGGGFVI